MAQSEPCQPPEDTVFFGRKGNQQEEGASKPLRLNPYVLGGEGLKGIALSVPWDILIPRHIDGAGKVAVVDMESKWWVVRMLADIRRESP